MDAPPGEERGRVADIEGGKHCNCGPQKKQWWS